VGPASHALGISITALRVEMSQKLVAVVSPGPSASKARHRPHPPTPDRPRTARNGRQSPLDVLKRKARFAQPRGSCAPTRLSSLSVGVAVTVFVPSCEGQRVAVRCSFLCF
jgi:hypothetical protein